MDITHLTNELSLIDFVIDALEVTGRIPDEPPALDMLPHFVRDNLSRFVLEAKDGGYVAAIYFDNAPVGAPDGVGTPDATPMPMELAFHYGARILCQIITGSKELPFFIFDKQLVVSTHTPQTSNWKRPWKVNMGQR